MSDDIDASYRKMDGMVQCPEGCGMTPYNPSKAGGRRCQHCGAHLDV